MGVFKELLIKCLEGETASVVMGISQDSLKHLTCIKFSQLYKYKFKNTNKNLNIYLKIIFKTKPLLPAKRWVDVKLGTILMKRGSFKTVLKMVMCKTHNPCLSGCRTLPWTSK